MLKTIKTLFRKSDDRETLYTPKDIQVKFALFYRNLEIGTLSLNNGLWTFQYSEDFKKQEKIKPLTDFPDINKVYDFEELHPFFVSRIPGINQPRVKEIINAEHIDQNNEVELLKRFGKRTISNPFILETV